MNITEAMPGCQSILVTPSRDRQSQQLIQQQGEVTSQYTSKSQLVQESGSWTDPGRGKTRRRHGGATRTTEGGDWRSCLLNLSLTPTSPPTPRLPLVPQLPPVLSIRDEKGKSRSDLPPHLQRRLL